MNFFKTRILMAPETEAGGGGAAPAAPAAAPSSSEHTASAQNSQSPQVTVSTGAPGTSSPKGGETAGKWYDAFDADTKEYVTQKGFQDPKAVIESYRNLEKLRGVPQDRLLKLPDAPDAPEWNDVYSKLGKPATPEGYGLSAADPNDTGFTDWAKTTFHSLNLTQAQGQELVKNFQAFQEQMESQARESHTAKVQEQVGTLRKEWGAAFQQNVDRAKAAYRQFGIPDTAIDSLEQSIGFDGVMKMFHKLGTQIGEHEFITGNTGHSLSDNLVLTPDQANARIRALKQDGAWVKKYLAKDVAAVKEMNRLMQFANPTD